MGEPVWTVVLPVKRLALAKSRLRGALGDVSHERLVLALTRDTVTAVLACPLVADALVVTDDPTAVAAVAALGARIVAEPSRCGAAGPPDPGLNAALAHGARLAEVSGPVAALTADLPALRPTELAAALRSAAAGAPARRRFVPDLASTGTVLLTAPAGTALMPSFGPDSAARHAASGAVPLAGDWPSLRRDVDTPTDLAEAAALGLGRHTGGLVYPDQVRC